MSMKADPSPACSKLREAKMEKVDILEAPDLHRRRFFSAATMALAAAELVARVIRIEGTAF